MELFIVNLPSKLELNNIYPQYVFYWVLLNGFFAWWRNKFQRFKNATTEELIKGITLSEERYRQLFNSGNDAIYLHDLSGKFLEVNDMACKMLGYSRKEFLKMAVNDIDDPELANANPGNWRKLFENGSMVCEMIHRKKDGTKIPVELSIKLIDLDGETLVMTHSRDITERKLAQEEIRRRNEELTELYIKEQEKSAIIQACHNIGHTLSSSVELNDMLTDFYRELSNLVKFDHMWLILIEESEAFRKTEIYTVADRFNKIGSYSFDEESWGYIRENKNALFQLKNTPFSRYFDLDADKAHLLACPLISNNKLIGLVVLTNNRREFSENDFEISENLTNHLGLAIDNSKLQAEVEKLAIKSERSRIAREFHDSVAQDVSVIRAKAELANKLLQRARYEEVAVILQDLETIAGEVYSEVRESIFGLKSTIDLQQGLIKILTEQVNRFQREWNIPVELIIQPDVPHKLDDAIEIQLLRVIMEALTNVRKHACATGVTIQLKVDDGQLMVIIIDDGQGFEIVDKGNFSDSYGLKAMQERMQTVNGWVNIYSSVGQGTTVQVLIPYENRGELI